MSRLYKIHKSQVNMLIRRKGSWSGWLAPCNVNEAHIEKGWGIGYKIKVNSIETLDRLIEQYQFYNCNEWELGYRVSLWQAEPPPEPRRVRQVDNWMQKKRSKAHGRK